MRFRTTVKNCPCKNCTDRVVGCHSTCEFYIDWKTARDEKIEQDRKTWQENEIYNSYYNDNIRKIYKAKKRQKGD